MTASRFISLWLPVLAFMALLFWFSSKSEVPSVVGVSDKLAHVAAFAVLGWLSLRASHGGIPSSLRARAVGLAVAVTLGYAIGDEIHQAFVPGRFPSLLDVVADAFGAGLAVGAMALYGVRTSGPK